MPRRGIRKQFWLTKEQAELLEVSARRACIPEVQFIRLLLKGYQPPPAPGEEFFEDMAELLKVSAELIAVSKICDPENASCLRSEAMALKELRLKLERKYLIGERRNLEWL